HRSRHGSVQSRPNPQETLRNGVQPVRGRYFLHSRRMTELWNTLAARGGVVLDAQRHAALERYLELLLAGNRKLNLTRIVDPAAARIGHIADALTLLPYLPLVREKPIALADVGSGGGVPGIPLAIVRPDLCVTLIESAGKKCAFLSETAASLGLKNVKV